MDYKDILRKKASVVQDLLNKYRESLSKEEADRIKVLIDNTYEITNGRLDALDYDVREEGIMNYHTQLDNALSKFRPFEEREKEDKTETRE